MEVFFLTFFFTKLSKKRDPFKSYLQTKRNKHILNLTRVCRALYSNQKHYISFQSLYMQQFEFTLRSPENKNVISKYR